MLPSMPGEALARVPHALREETARLGRAAGRAGGGPAMSAPGAPRAVAPAARALPRLDRQPAVAQRRARRRWRRWRSWPRQRGLTPGQLPGLASDSDPPIRQALIERLVIRTTWFMREPDAILGLAAAFSAAGAHRRRQPGARSGRSPAPPARSRIRWRWPCWTPGLEPTILATDVSDEAREQRRAPASTPAEKVADLPVRWRQRFFYDPGHGRVRGDARAARSAVTFLPLQPGAQPPVRRRLGQLRRRRLPERAAVLRAPRGRAHPARAGRDRAATTATCC